MSDSTCKHCGQGVNFIRLRNGYDWCHILGSTRCNRLDSTVAEPESWGER